MSELTLGDALEITQGAATNLTDLSQIITSAVYDSREVSAGSLFAAFRGTHNNGHDFVDQAVANGAIAALVSEKVSTPAILVPDVLAALVKLAKSNRDRLNCPVLALTGSSGKTTTKDLLIDLLAPLGPVLAPTGSRNNELGMPSTLIGANRSSAAVVLEMGARHKGNIRELCEIARPNIVGITLIGSAHLGEFGSREAIMQTKGEIVELLNTDGVAVLNADQPESRIIAKRTSGKVWYAGYDKSADIQISNLTLDTAGRPSFVLKTAVGEISTRMNLIGKHQAQNAAIAVGMALAANVSLADIEIALAAATPRSALRMATEKIAEVTLIDDTYNANPESVIAALVTLGQISCAGRRIAVLGEMAELGEAAKELHQQVGAAAETADLLIGIGDWGAEIVAGATAGNSATQRSVTVPDRESALELLRHEMKKGDLVLFKASRAAGFDTLAASVRDYLKSKES